ncbi:MAG: type II and III secretion system protein [Planctomycetes bacterium]|nr:type II and III secretion system protein [Planctomycetota bacterium]
MRTPKALAAAALTLAACAAPDIEREQEHRRNLSMDMFRSLIEEGTLKPVDSMNESFSTFPQDMDDDAYMEELLTEYRESKQVQENESGAAEPVDPAPGDLEDPAPYVEDPDFIEDTSDYEEVINPYALFGQRILVHYDQSGESTGLITKPYSVRPGMGEKIIWLLNNYGGFQLWTPGEGAQPLGTLRAEVQENFELEQFASNLRSTGPDNGVSINIADWVIATADATTLSDFEYFLDVMFAGPPQIEIEAKIVEYVLSDTLDIGVGPVNDGTPVVGLPDSGLFDSFNWTFPNRTGGTEFLTTLQAVHDGTTYNFLLEALASYENVEITSRPKTAVREGTRATIESTQQIPYYQITGVNNSGGVNAGLSYSEVGVRMYAIPRLVGGSTISLEIEIEASQQTGTDVSFVTTGGEEISTPTLGVRRSNTLVYLKPGQAVILGGLITERSVDDERKVPLLGDIPIMGHLFKSKYQRKELVSVLFFIRPRVLEGIDLHRDF